MDRYQQKEKDQDRAKERLSRRQDGESEQEKYFTSPQTPWSRAQKLSKALPYFSHETGKLGRFSRCRSGTSKPCSRYCWHPRTGHQPTGNSWEKSFHSESFKTFYLFILIPPPFFFPPRTNTNALRGRGGRKEQRKRNDPPGIRKTYLAAAPARPGEARGPLCPQRPFFLWKDL